MHGTVTIWLPEEGSDNDNTIRHTIVEEENLTGPHPGTKSYSQMTTAEEREHQSSRG